MTKQEQDKRWAQLSKESKKYFIDQVADLQRLINAPSPSQAMRDEWRGLIQGYENVFGSHNLKPQMKVTYDTIISDLKEIGKHRVISANLVYTSRKQFEKVEAITKLLNVTSWLNGDWKPDFKIKDEFDNRKWFIYLDSDDNIDFCWDTDCLSRIVYFRTKELAEQAIQILGEETIRLALITDY